MAELRADPLLMVGEGWDAFRLLDSGHGRKFEHYGGYRFIRPEPQAMWSPKLAEWEGDGEFVPGSDEDGGGRWQFAKPVPSDGWELGWGDQVRFTAQCTAFRHLGFFPDMAPVWDWMGERLSPPPVVPWEQLRFQGRGSGGGGCDRDMPHPNPSPEGEGLSSLNLFGYTGVGTLALSRFGRVTHVDASKKSVAQARENAALSGLAEAPIRWLVDEAAKFTAREVRRGKRYDGIILDPPKFGRGPDGEVWRLEEGLPGLVADCRRLLDCDSRFLFLTVYAVRMSSLALAGLLDEAFIDLPGMIEHGDLAVKERSGGRLLPTAIFARWSNPG